jgi:hypothetical protein
MKKLVTNKVVGLLIAIGDIENFIITTKKKLLSDDITKHSKK